MADEPGADGPGRAERGGVARPGGAVPAQPASPTQQRAVPGPAARQVHPVSATRASTLTYERRSSRRFGARVVAVAVLMLAVLIPVLLSAYYGYFATDRYVTSAQFSVRSASQQAGLPDIISGTTGIPSASGMLGAFQDAFVVREFVHSQELVDRIDREVGMVALFGGPKVDWWSRLDADATREDKFDYWQHRVSADLDATTGLVTLTVAAFSPEDSLKLAEHILAASQELVNALSEQARRDALAFAAAEVAKAEDRLRAARMAVTAFRKEKGDIFPEASAKAQLELIAQLQFEVAKGKAELAAMNLKAGTPTQRAAAARIAALEAQVVKERNKLTGTAAHAGSSAPLSDLLIEYQALEVDRMFAEQFYTGSLTLLEAARQEALRIQRYLVVFVRPGLAETPTEPRRGWAVLTVLASTLAAYIILGVLYKTVKEHVI
jgi:capsular polysaccharide transport system permease protein